MNDAWGDNRAARVRRGRWVSLFVALLLGSAAAFAIGVAVERRQVSAEASSPVSTATGESAHTGESSPAGESGETGHAGEGTPATASGTPATTAPSSESGVSLLGVNPESTGAVVAALLLSLALAAAAWWPPLRALRLVLLAGAVFCLAAAALDLREVTHQVTEKHTGVAALVVLVLVLHLAAAASAGVALRATGLRVRTSTN